MALFDLSVVHGNKLINRESVDLTAIQDRYRIDRQSL
jgi:hypothetical protein